jgi:S1/P1 Nuclease
MALHQLSLQASERARRHKPLAPHPDNILSGLAENQRIVKSQVSANQRAIALAWLFHLVGDVHQPLHMVQLFSREYPHGDRGGNEVCLRLAPGGVPLDLHRLWDGLITSTNNVGQLRNIATELLSKFSRVGLRELDQMQPDAWAKESYEIAVKIAYENGNLRGTPKGRLGLAARYKTLTLYPAGIPEELSSLQTGGSI